MDGEPRWDKKSEILTYTVLSNADTSRFQLNVAPSNRYPRFTMNIANHFTIDSTDFGIGSATFRADSSGGTFTLEIVGDESLATAMSAQQTHPFNWIIYPPKFYVRTAMFTSTGDGLTLDIDDDVLDDYDIALYLIDHNDVFGRLTIAGDGLITFVGTTSINGTEKRPSTSRCAMICRFG